MNSPQEVSSAEDKPSQTSVAPELPGAAALGEAPQAESASPPPQPWFARYQQPGSQATTPVPSLMTTQVVPAPLEEAPRLREPILVRPLSQGPAPTTEIFPVLSENARATPLAPRAPTAKVATVAPTAQPSHLATTKRQPILGSEFDKPVDPSSGARQPVSYIVNTPKPVNQRRHPNITSLIGLVFLANVLLIGAFAVWHFNYFTTEIETRLAEVNPTLPTASSSSTSEWKNEVERLRSENTVLQAQMQSLDIAVKQSESAKKASQQNASATLLEQIAGLKTQTQQLQTELQASEKRLAVAEQRNLQQAARMEELSAGFAKLEASAKSAADLPLSPSQSELVLLKERNRLTAYADEAIATGARGPYERLWEAIDDPRLVPLVHAARSEILRVQHYYLSGSRIDRFEIPVGVYFPEASALQDSQLSDEQLIKLLSNQKHPWEVRMKAANLLGRRRSKPTGDALVASIQSDPNLDVVKEATYSFEQMTGFRDKMFEPASLVAWWHEANGAPKPKPEAPAEVRPATPAPSPPSPPTASR
ncbi:MAG: hypothetical protein ACOYMN_09560 [Roseimicrobium sp.]